jgi:hypothetical protein
MVKDDPMFLFIGTYPSEAAARADYDVVKDLHAAEAVGTYDAAVITKDSSGKVHVNKDEMATRQSSPRIRPARCTSTRTRWRRGMEGGALVLVPAGVLSFLPRDNRVFSCDPVTFEIGEDLFGAVRLSVAEMGSVAEVVHRRSASFTLSV